MTNRYDPATWLEAAQQLREEAERGSLGNRHWTFDASVALDTMARRFENEAKVAEEAKGETGECTCPAFDPNFRQWCKSRKAKSAEGSKADGE